MNTPDDPRHGSPPFGRAWSSSGWPPPELAAAPARWDRPGGRRAAVRGHRRRPGQLRSEHRLRDT